MTDQYRSAIESVQLRDTGDPYAPAERLMEVALVNSTLFITIADHEETNKEKTLKNTVTMGVDKDTFLNALRTLEDSNLRETLLNAKRSDFDSPVRLPDHPDECLCNDPKMRGMP